MVHKLFDFGRYLIIVALFGATFFFRLSIDRIEDEKRYLLVPPPPEMKYFSFGFNEAFADSLWLRYIQDMEKCKLVGIQGERSHVCDKGWAFQMLDQITDLAPRFRMPYSIGPLSLTVIDNDNDGANILFEKAIKAFPDDWHILYKAAYFYLYEEKDNRKAASLLMAAHQHGGPFWLPILASRLYSRTGQLELGISTLEIYLKQVANLSVKAEIKQKLAVLYCERAQLANGAAEPDEKACSKERAH